MKSITLEEFLEGFDASVHDRLQALAREENTYCLVRFENQMLDSSHLGECTALTIGPGHTYKTLSEVEGRHLHDLPSQRQYPVAYWRKDAPAFQEETTE